MFVTQTYFQIWFQNRRQKERNDENNNQSKQPNIYEMMKNRGIFLLSTLEDNDIFGIR